jgi:predicted MPP superfamily phosphohydrolase
MRRSTRTGACARRTHIEELREKIAQQGVQVLAKTEEAKATTASIRLLHLSDLHFAATMPVQAQLQWLLDDLKHDGGLGFKALDYLVISSDFSDKGCPEGFDLRMSGTRQLISGRRQGTIPG